MALDPKGLYGEGWWDEKTPDLPSGVTPPSGVDWSSGNYYAHFRINNDGTREIQWYQRGPGRPWYQQLPGSTAEPPKPDPVMATTSDQMPAGSEVAKAWAAAQSKETATAQRGDQEGDTRGPQNGPQREVYRSGKWVTEDNPLYQAGTAGTTSSNPRVPAGSIPRIEGTPIPGRPGEYDNSQPVRAWHAPDGSIVYEPLTPAEILDEQRKKNGGKTDAEMAKPPEDTVNPADPTRMRRPDGKGGWVDAGPNAAGVQAAADRNKPGAPTIKPDGKGGSIIIQTMPDGSIKTTAAPEIPSDKPQPHTLQVNGITYERGEDGVYAPAKGIPSEGAATASTQTLPDFVHMAAAEGLRQTWEALQADPTLTPAQRATKFQEAVQIATLAQTNANNEELRRQSERNAASNEAKYRLDAQQTGLGHALDFVNTIIKSGSGSQSAGAGFAAIMGLTMLQMERSGIDTLGTKAPLPVVTAADITDPTRAAAKAAEVSAHIDAATKPPENAQTAAASAEADRQAAQARQVGGTPTPGEPGGSPLTPGAVLPTPGVSDPRDAPGYTGPPTAPAPAAPPAPVGQNPDAGQALGPTGDAPPLATPATPTYVPPTAPTTPDYGAPGMRVLPQPAAPGPAPAPEAAPAPAPADDMVTVRSLTGQTMTVPRSQWDAPWTPTKFPAWPAWHEVPATPPAAPAPAPTYSPPSDPADLTPGAPTQVPGAAPGVSVPYPSNAGEMSKTLPGQDWPALAQYQPQPAPVQTAGQPDNGQAPAALLAAKVKSTPPWRLSNDELAWAHANGLLNDAMSIPGRSAA